MSQQSAPHGLSATLDLIDEVHGLVYLLAKCAADIESALREREPKWQAVRDAFELHQTIGKTLSANWHLLEPFARTRKDAVVWREQGWASWHHAVAESLACGPHGRGPGFVLWVGTNPDTIAPTDVVAPGELDWLAPDLGGKGRYCTREDAWRRIRYCAGIEYQFERGDFVNEAQAAGCSGMLLSGWYHMHGMGAELWTLLPHLRSECAAARRDAEHTVSTPATIWYHGEQSYSANGTDLVNVTDEEHTLLNECLKHDRALTCAELKRSGGVTNPSRVARQLVSKYEGRFAGAARLPGKGGKGSGYHFRVRLASSA